MAARRRSRSASRKRTVAKKSVSPRRRSRSASRGRSASRRRPTPVVPQKLVVRVPATRVLRSRTIKLVLATQSVTKKRTASKQRRSSSKVRKIRKPARSAKKPARTASKPARSTRVLRRRRR